MNKCFLVDPFSADHIHNTDASVRGQTGVLHPWLPKSLHALVILPALNGEEELSWFWDETLNCPHVCTATNPQNQSLSPCCHFDICLPFSSHFRKTFSFCCCSVMREICTNVDQTCKCISHSFFFLNLVVDLNKGPKTPMRCYKGVRINAKLE